MQSAAGSLDFFHFVISGWDFFGLDTLIWRCLRTVVHDCTILSLIKAISLVASWLSIMGAREWCYLLEYGFPQLFAPNPGLTPSRRFVVHYGESF